MLRPSRSERMLKLDRSSTPSSHSLRSFAVHVGRSKIPPPLKSSGIKRTGNCISPHPWADECGCCTGVGRRGRLLHLRICMHRRGVRIVMVHVVVYLREILASRRRWHIQRWGRFGNGARSRDTYSRRAKCRVPLTKLQ